MSEWFGVYVAGELVAACSTYDIANEIGNRMYRGKYEIRSIAKPRMEASEPIEIDHMSAREVVDGESEDQSKTHKSGLSESLGIEKRPRARGSQATE